MPNDLPYFPFYVDDFAADGNVEAMTTLEVGSYILLLCKAWKENPRGTLPANDAVLARWSRLTPDEWSAAKPRVMECFRLGSDGRWHQKRMELEARKLRDLAYKRSIAGKEGAKGRWQTHGKRMDLPMANECDRMPRASGSDSGSSLEEEKEKTSKKNKKGKGGAGGKPEREAAARRVVEHYQNAVQPAHDRSRGIHNVTVLLGKGLDEPTLCRCADGYADFCRRADKQPQYRVAVGNFYGKAGTYEQFLAWISPSPPRASESNEFVMPGEHLTKEELRESAKISLMPRRKAEPPSPEPHKEPDSPESSDGPEIPF